MSQPLLDITLCILAAPLLFYSGYLGLLSILARRPEVAPDEEEGAAFLQFNVIVPAHNEGGGIATTVASLLALDYPKGSFRVIVIADNCSDDTAEIAKAAGATVIARHDGEHQGKGYALELAMQRAVAEGWCDAVIVVDADSVASANLLRRFAWHFKRGAMAVQARYLIRENPHGANHVAKWRTPLMQIGFSLLHVVRASARERLQLSVGLRGNGMGFSTELIRKVPYSAFSLVEDLEYGIQLARAGHRVHDVGDASIVAEMPVDAGATETQRQRWEGGREKIRRQHLWLLVRQGLANHDWMLLDQAMELAVPPLSSLVFGLLFFVGAGAMLHSLPVLVISAATFLLLSLYVLRGWSLSGAGYGGLWALACAPLYLLWKVSMSLKRKENETRWVRTRRVGER